MVIEISSLLIGTLCLFFGYKLLMRGIHPEQHAAESFHNQGLFKRSVPGALFAVFGAVMIGGALLHSTQAHRKEATAVTSEEDAPGKPESTSQAPRRKHVRAKEPRQIAPAAQAAHPKAIAPVAPAEPALEDSAPVPQPSKVNRPGRA